VGKVFFLPTIIGYGGQKNTLPAPTKIRKFNRAEYNCPKQYKCGQPGRVGDVVAHQNVKIPQYLYIMPTMVGKKTLAHPTN